MKHLRGKRRASSNREAQGGRGLACLRARLFAGRADARQPRVGVGPRLLGQPSLPVAFAAAPRRWVFLHGSGHAPALPFRVAVSLLRSGSLRTGNGAASPGDRGRLGCMRSRLMPCQTWLPGSGRCRRLQGASRRLDARPLLPQLWAQRLRTGLGGARLPGERGIHHRTEGGHGHTAAGLQELTRVVTHCSGVVGWAARSIWRQAPSAWKVSLLGCGCCSGSLRLSGSCICLLLGQQSLVGPVVVCPDDPAIVLQNLHKTWSATTFYGVDQLAVG